MTSRLAVVLLVAGGLGCAARSAPVLTADLARADALVRQGCYDCLLDARTVYQPLARDGRPDIIVRALEVELLLALREKELALDATSSLSRARTLAEGLAPRIDVRQYVAQVEAVPPDATGRRPVPPSAAARDELQILLTALERSPFSPHVRRYLALSFQCGRLPVTELPTDGAVPLVSYRLAICDNPIDVEPLRVARAAVPAFVETSFYRGRAAMGSLFGSDGREVSTLLEEAHARFPDSPAIAFTLGTVYQATGDCRRADDLFSRALAVRDDHDEARLGRAVCRTYLSRSEEAIADATVLIDRTAANRAEAYYWRAWNHRHLKRLESARSDIDGARALLYNSRVLALAGMIEHDQREFDKAREDLSRARDMDSRECQARWYLGLVGYGTESWAESADGFADAAECYARAIADTQRQREAMAARDDLSAEFRTRQLAGFDAAIAEDSSQKSAADLNAAINYARAQDVDKATTYMKRAAADPERRVAVEDLRQVLGVPRW